MRLPRIYRLLRMVRLLKIYKVVKKTKAYSKFEQFWNLHSGVMRLLTFFLAVIMFVHLAGCMWVLMAKINDFSPDTWVYH